MRLSMNRSSVHITFRPSKNFSLARSNPKEGTLRRSSSQKEEPTLSFALYFSKSCLNYPKASSAAEPNAVVIVGDVFPYWLGRARPLS